MVSMVEWRDALYGESGLSAAIERIHQLRSASATSQADSGVTAEDVIGVAFAEDHARVLAENVYNLAALLGEDRRAMTDALFDSLD